MIPLTIKNDTVVQPASTLSIGGRYDVIVAGGGIAGFGAGVAAARRGCRTLIIEQWSALGGLATLGLVNIPLDYACGIGAEMFDELKAVEGLWHRNSDPEKHKLVLDRMARAAGCDLLFVTSIVESLVREGVICGVVTESKSGRQAFLADRVVDCTGDGDVAALAGCRYSLGRASDGLNQAVSLEFRLGGVNWDAYQNSDLKANDPKWVNCIRQALDVGDLAEEADNHLNWITHVPGRTEHVGQDEVSICFAHSRHCRVLDNRDLTRMYLEGREQSDMLWKFIRKRIPGFENCWLVDTAPLLGVRDGRRILGEYVMTGWDLARRARFDDVICISSHGYDVHNPTGPGNIKYIEREIGGETRYVIFARSGMGSTCLPPGGLDALSDTEGRTGEAMQFPEEMASDGQTEMRKPYYDVPYRSLVPVDLDHLLVAGRCLSSDFEAQSGCRLIMTCLNMGQAAGTAAALSLSANLPPRRLPREMLQSNLIADGMNLGQRYRAIPGVTETATPKT